jgi:hypothetical protein
VRSKSASGGTQKVIHREVPKEGFAGNKSACCSTTEERLFGKRLSSGRNAPAACISSSEKDLQTGFVRFSERAALTWTEALLARPAIGRGIEGTGVVRVEWQKDKACLGWFFVPKGQEDSAQGFNPGNRTPVTTRPVRAQDGARQ